LVLGNGQPVGVGHGCILTETVTSSSTDVLHVCFSRIVHTAPSNKLTEFMNAGKQDKTQVGSCCATKRCVSFESHRPVVARTRPGRPSQARPWATPCDAQLKRIATMQSATGRLGSHAYAKALGKDETDSSARSHRDQRIHRTG